MFARIRKLGLAVMGAASNSLGCERLWKALGETISKKRGKMEIHNAADQTLLKMIWKVAGATEELSALRPSLNAARQEVD